jgi:hypothetical protein
MGEAKQNIIALLSITQNEILIGLPQLMLHKIRPPRWDEIVQKTNSHYMSL